MADTLAQIHTPTDVWWTALSSPLSLTCAGIALGLLIAGCGVMWLIWQLRRLQPVHLRSRRGESGTATIEFALVLPILLFIALALIQTMLVMGGNLYVFYSAYAATRSAIVQIPADYGSGEDPNFYSQGGRKHQYIRRAAVMALVPVSASDGDAGGGGVNLASGIQSFYSAYGRTAPPWVDKLDARYAYADANTEVFVRRTLVQGDDVAWEDVTSGDFEPKEPISVRVDHRLNLPIQYVAGIFSDGETGGRRYMEISAQYTLTNEGLLTEMPPDPELERREPQGTLITTPLAPTP